MKREREKRHNEYGAGEGSHERKALLGAARFADTCASLPDESDHRILN